MSAFDIDEQGQARVDEWATANLLNEDAPAPPGAFEGALTGIGEGIMRGGARAAQAVGILAQPILRSTNPALANDPSLTDPYFEAVDDTATNAVDHWTPAAGEIGKVGQVLGGFSEIVLPLMAGGGNPSLLIAQSTTGPAVDLVRQGVDAETATAVGVTQGFATAVGFKMPFLGNSLATKMLSGAIGNTVINAGATAIQREELQAGGYEDLAAGYDSLDLESRAIDVLTGLAFGAIDHAVGRPMLPSQVEAIAAAANAKHFQFDTAPGRPVNMSDSVTHQAAMETATEQTLKGEPVAVQPAVTEAAFIPRPERAPIEIPEELVALDEARAADTVKSDATAEAEGYAVAEGVLTDEQLAQFEGLRSRVQANEVVGGPREGDAGQAGRSNDGSPRGEPLRVYRGAAREISAEDFKGEALGHATGHPSSGLGVFFTNAAGDAARYGPVSEHFLDIKNPKVIAVEDLPGFDTLNAADAYRKAIAAEGHDGIIIDASHLGGPVNYVAFTHEQVKSAPKSSVTSDVRLEEPAARDAIESLRGEIGLSEKGGRLTRDADGNVTGRTAHIGSPLWMNRPSEGGQISAKAALAALDRVKEGKPLGAAQKRFISYALDELDQVTDARTEYVNEAGARDLPPDVAAAQEYLAGADILVPTGALDEEGVPIARSARELMAEAQAEIAQAEADAVGFEAAVNCFLTRGADAT